MLGGGIALFFGVNAIFEGYQSNTWPVVQGIVVESDIQKNYSPKHGRVYKPDVNYQYTFKGVSYLGNRIHPINYSSDSISSVNKLLAKYPVDMDIEVFVNPKDPTKSLLESGAGYQAYLLLFFGLLFGGVGFFFSVFLPQRISKFLSKRK